MLSRPLGRRSISTSGDVSKHVGRQRRASTPRDASLPPRGGAQHDEDLSSGARHDGIVLGARLVRAAVIK
jgi:hypothetical protein